MATRDRKDPDVSRQELFEQWRATNAKAGFDDKAVARLLRHGPRKPKGNVRKIVRMALKRQKNHFTEADLVYRTLVTLPNFGLSPEAGIQEVQRLLNHDPDIVLLGTFGREQRYATKRMLTEERRMLEALNKLSSRPGNVTPEHKVSRHLAEHPDLTQEQVEFVRHLTQTPKALRIGLGLAGTGKTSRALKACVAIWKRQGFRVLAATPTGQASRILGDEIGVECATLTKFLGDYQLTLSSRLAHHARQLGRALRGRRTWPVHRPKPAKITRKTIVLVDESGMATTPHTRMIAELVERGGGTLCLIGDHAQLPAVESTSPLQSLARRYGAAELRDIRRQKEEWARKAATLFADGLAGPALALYASKNKVTVRDDLEQAVRQACLEWTEDGLLTPHRTVILTTTNALAHTASLLCQEHRLRAGVLQDSPSIRITDEQEDAVYESQAYVHDRVLFTKNSLGRKGYGVCNGSVGTITAISPFTPEIAVRLDDGRSVRVNAAKYRHVRLAYAMTTYKAQGASIPTVRVIVGDALQNLPASYVQATRGIEDTQFYTTKDLLNASLENVEHSVLAKQMSRRPDLRLIADLFDDVPLDLRSRKPRIRTDAGPRGDQEPPVSGGDSLPETETHPTATNSRANTT